MPLRTLLLSSASAAVLAGVVAQPAAATSVWSGPAVAAPNANIAGLAGNVDGHDFTLGSAGQLAIPLTANWGFQADGIGGSTSVDGESYYGGTAHLFKRDPKQGFIGGYVSDVGWTLSDYDRNRARRAVQSLGQVGGEGGAYLGRFTVRGAAGYEFGSDIGLAALGKIAFYPRDDLRLEAGVSYLQGLGGGFNADIEWAPTGGASVFATAVGNVQSGSVLFGLKAYFGPTAKSLIRREREDFLPDDLYTIVGNGYCPVGANETRGFCDGNS